MPCDRAAPMLPGKSSARLAGGPPLLTEAQRPLPTSPLRLRHGLAVAMRAHPDGDVNEVRFVGDLVPEVRQLSRGKTLWLGDSSFCDLTQPAHFAEQGDAFLVRYHPKVPFYADPVCPARTPHRAHRTGRRDMRVAREPERPCRFRRDCRPETRLTNSR